MALSDSKIKKSKALDKHYKLSDGAGLYLEVRKTGAKFWRYRFHLNGKEGVFTIGEYPEVSLSEARAERKAAKAWAKAGINPNTERERLRQLERAERVNSFEAVAREYAGKKAEQWSVYYAKQWQNMMAADVFSDIGGMPIRDVTAHDILRVLNRVEARGATTVAINIRMWCSQVFRYAVATLRADTDPASALKGALIRKAVRHNPGLDVDGIKKLLVDLGDYAGYRPTVIAMHLLLRLFTRTVELRKARWEEFDLDDEQVWMIPAERMKMRVKHLVPLSTQAVALLTELKALTGGGELLFPNLRRPKDCITSTTINRTLERMGYEGKLSGHGFRTTASTLLHEMGYRSELIEKQLAHTDKNKVRASYNHAEYLPERRTMMQAWSDHIDKQDDAS